MDLNKYCGEIFVFNNKNGEMVVKALENQGFELVLNRADKEMFSYVIKIKKTIKDTFNDIIIQEEK